MTSTQRKRLLERDKEGKAAFKYVPAASTNLHHTFARIRQEQAKQTLRRAA